MPGNNPDAAYFTPAFSRCLLEGATNKAFALAYTLPCGDSLKDAVIHNFRPSIFSTSTVASSSLPGVASTFYKHASMQIISFSHQRPFAMAGLVEQGRS